MNVDRMSRRTRPWSNLVGENGKVTEFCRRLRSNRYSIVRIGNRLFTVAAPRSIQRRQRSYYAYVRPLPRHRGNQTFRVEDGTYLMFQLRGKKGQFKQIEVFQARARRGWATDMVKALLKAHPDVVWQNGSLNENSGPLFEKLSAQFPTRIAKVASQPDGSFLIGLPLWLESRG